MKITDSVNEAGVFPPNFRSVLNPFAGRISVRGCRGLAIRHDERFVFKEI